MRMTLFLPALFVLSMVFGCSTLPNGRGWGQDVTLLPGWDRVRDAAVDAALSPWTWAPAAGALVFQIDDWDEETNEWASDHTPVFGSTSGAKDTSDALEITSAAIYMTTALATPSGEKPVDWTVNKAKGIGTGLAAVWVNDTIVNALKDATHRERPDGRGDNSFPSKHASGTAAFCTLAHKNLDSLDLPKTGKSVIRGGLITLSAATAWARVEGNRHYPSDVLAGLALGHFLGAFINDAFLGLKNSEKLAITTEASREGVAVLVHWTF